MSHILVRYEEDDRLEIRKRGKERVKETRFYTSEDGRSLKAFVLNCSSLVNLKKKKLEMENGEQISVEKQERRPPMKKCQKKPRRKEEEEEESSSEEEWTPVKERLRRSTRKQEEKTMRNEEEEEEEEEGWSSEEEWKPEREGLRRPTRKQEENTKRKEEEEGSSEEEWKPEKEQSRAPIRIVDESRSMKKPEERLTEEQEERMVTEEVTVSTRREEENAKEKEEENPTEKQRNSDATNARPKERKRSRSQKSHNCLFCSQLYQRIKNHLRTVHKNEPEVEDILATTTRGHQRLKWNILVAKGDLEYNKRVLEGQGGTLKTLQKRRKTNSTMKMVQCDNCWAIIRPKSMSLHRDLCSKLGRSEEKPPNTLSQLKDDGFYEEVVKDMKFGFPDVVLSSNMLYNFGKYLWKQKGYRYSRQIQQKLRYLKELEDELQEDGSEKVLNTFLRPKWVDRVVTTIKKICGFVWSDRKLVIKFPSKVLKFTTLVVEVASYEKLSSLKRGHQKRAKKIQNFISVFEGETNKALRLVARRHMENTRRRKMEDLPTMEDVRIITRHLEEEAPGLLSKLKKSPDGNAWMLLRDNLVIWTGLFNRRRGGASEKLKLADYYRARKVAEKDLERVKNATKEEMEFLRSLRVASIEHKEHVVQLFIPELLQEAIQTLVAYRWAAGIREENEYVFAAGQDSTKPVRATNVFMKYKNLLPPQSRDKMNFTNLRKQGATVVRVLDLDNDDLDNWALHMGHTRSVHDRFYTLKGNPESILKTGKILSLLRNGGLKDNIGRKLDDIRLDLDTSLPTQQNDEAA